ncbi:MAG: Hsp20/alpha crystallin family protein [Phycisphaerales bacterium]|jgi:HSP20 family molecular chaperone IbpA|nr:Hsp20/alpha crystallin family protein [Phycisphaerales bacterium]
MAINVQVKDNRGCESTFTGRTSNGYFTDRFGSTTWGQTPHAAAPGMGVAPVATGVEFGSDACPINVGMMPDSAFQTMPHLQRVPFVQTGMTDLETSFGPRAIVNRIAMIDPAAAQLAIRLTSIDPRFIANLSKIADGCPWTAAKLTKVANIDLSLARQLIGLARINPSQAMAIAATAEVSPIQAMRQLETLTWSVPMYDPGMGIRNDTSLNSFGQYATIPVDIAEDANTCIIEADVPGISLENIELTATNGRLMLEVTAGGAASLKNGVTPIIRERQAPRMLRREFVLGNDIDLSGITARVDHGVLSIVLPRKVGTVEQVLNREVSLAC